MRVGFVVLGAAGYMANDNGLPSLVRAKHDLALLGHQLELLALADPAFFDEKRTVRARTNSLKFFAQLNQCDFYYDAESAIRDVIFGTNIAAGKLPDRVIIYDASWALFHSENLTRVLYSTNDRVFYLGEKPIFFDPETIQIVKQEKFVKFFCDFIETSDPAIVEIKQLIKRNRYQIKDMAFWRAGGTGVKKTVGHEQAGVQGGALLDKAPHDFSISTMLLEPTEIERFSIDEATIHHLISRRTAGEYEVLNASNSFVPINGTCFDNQSAQTGSRFTLAADGLSSCKMTWHLFGGHAVPCRYLFSWLGYMGHLGMHNPEERWFVEQLNSLGVTEDDWLMKEIHAGSDRRCIETQARIGIITVTDSEKRKFRFVTNLIMADAKEHGQRAVRRWAKLFGPLDIPEGTSINSLELNVENAKTYREQKIRDLADIFRRVALNTLDLQDAKYLSSRAVIQVHEAMLAARDVAVEKAKDSWHRGEVSLESTSEYIQRSIVT